MNSGDIGPHVVIPLDCHYEWGVIAITFSHNWVLLFTLYINCYYFSKVIG